MANKKDKVIHTTPIGTVSWERFRTADQYDNYSCQLTLVPSKEVNAFLEMLDEELDLAFSQDDRSKKGYVKANRPFTENEDGTFTYRFRQNTSIVDKKTHEVIQFSPPPVKDSKGVPISADISVGNGSKARVAFTVRSWGSPKDKEIGIKLDPKAMQIAELVEYNSDAGYKFDEIEDGYSVSDDDIPFDPPADDDEQKEFY